MEKHGDGFHRLVLVPYLLQGHVTPLLQLGTILHSRGFSITVAHTKSYSPDTSSHPDFVFLPLPLDESMPSIHNNSVDFVTVITSLNSSCRVSLQELLIEMIQKQEQHERLPCIIYDSLMYSTKEVVHHLKLPSIMFDTSCATFMRVCPEIQKPGYSSFQDTSSAIVFNSSDCLERPSLTQLRQIYKVPILPIGPLHKLAPAASSSTTSSLIEEDKSCIAWLDKQTKNSVIYVSLGSIASLDEKELTEMAWGLANSKQPFLWVLRPGSVHGSEAIALFSNDFKENIGERGYIVKWAPQKQVLAHKAVGGFWSHCGWNSTIESISEGVPMICRPFFGDQNIKTRYISHVWRVGIELENDLQGEEIERAIRRLMVENEGEEMRQRAADLKQQLEISIQKGGPSYDSLNELVELIMSV
ncbi:hypothetical protein EZV62_002796 [Acer yangbiense]|uniref:Glycosyltransferase n=1 Tax=Acer yangbiense TaxID=1000413 RepID=A0A5C7IY48_9ROSI|nr:hypothetical protein EZV62_002796 [Acer yangbiense]